MRDTATLVVLGSDESSSGADLTRRLGLQPTTVLEANQPAGGRRVRPYAIWHLEVQVDPVGGAGTSSLHALLERILESADAIRALAADPAYEARISWGASSDSSQGGFVLDAADAAMLGAIGLPLHGTVYLDDPDEG